MSNQKLVPRNDNEGSLGTPTKRWGDAHFASATIDSLDATFSGVVQSGSFEGEFTGSATGSFNGDFSGDFSGDGANLLNVRSVQHRVNSVTVSEKSDLPAPTGSIITLEENTEYLINGMVNIGTDVIHYNTGSYIGGLNIQADSIYYAGTAAALNSNNVGQIVGSSFSIIAPSGSAIDLRQDDNIHQLNYDYVGFVGCNKIGTISGFDVAALKSCAQVPIIGVPSSQVNSGVTFTGTSNKVFIDACVFQDTTGGDYSIYFDANANCDVVDIKGTYFKSDELTTIEVHASASITEGRLINNVFRGTKTNGPVTGFNQSSIGWEFIANTNLRDTTVISNFYIPDGTGGVTIPISAVNTPVKLDVTTEQNPDSQKFIHSGNNRTTYVGLKDFLAQMTSTMTIESTANSQTFEIFWYKNGVKIQGSRAQVRVQQSGVRLNVSAISGIRLETNDYVELWVQNTTSDADLIVHTMAAFVRK